MRIADLGKPRIMIIGGGFGGLEVPADLKGFNARAVPFAQYNQYDFQSLFEAATTAFN